MPGSISPRLLEVVQALPLKRGLRVLEVGCGPGVGRHPEKQHVALERIRAALRSNGRLFIDGGDPVREVPIVGA